LVKQGVGRSQPPDARRGEGDLQRAFDRRAEVSCVSHTITQFCGALRRGDGSEPSLGRIRIGDPQQQERGSVQEAITGAEDSLNVLIFADRLGHKRCYISESHWRISVSVMALRSRPWRIRVFLAISTRDNPG